jgi:hypothetical protein
MVLGDEPLLFKGGFVTKREWQKLTINTIRVPGEHRQEGPRAGRLG